MKKDEDLTIDELAGPVRAALGYSGQYKSPNDPARAVSNLPRADTPIPNQALPARELTADELATQENMLQKHRAALAASKQTWSNR